MLREGVFQASICNVLSLVLLWKITGVILTWSTLTWSVPLSVKVKKQRIYSSHKWDARTCLHGLSPGTMFSNGILISVEPKTGAPRSTNLETHWLNVCSLPSWHILLYHIGPRALWVCSGPKQSAGSLNLISDIIHSHSWNSQFHAVACLGGHLVRIEIYPGEHWNMLLAVSGGVFQEE